MFLRPGALFGVCLVALFLGGGEVGKTMSVGRGFFLRVTVWRGNKNYRAFQGGPKESKEDWRKSARMAEEEINVVRLRLTNETGSPKGDLAGSHP